MVFINTNSDKATLNSFADSVDYNGIAALGDGAAPTGGESPDVGVSDEEESEDVERTPGFEVVFTIAGLLAVAYLVRRRN